MTMDLDVDKIIAIKTDLASRTTECETLKIRLNECLQSNYNLTQELNECRAKLYEISENYRRAEQDVARAKQLEQENNNIQKNCLILGEKNHNYKQRLFELTMSKSPCDGSCHTLKEIDAEEIKSLKSSLEAKTIQLDFSIAKNRELDGQIEIKEKCIDKLKERISNLMTGHEFEIRALEDQLNSLKNICSLYENRTLAKLSMLQNDDIEESHDRLP